jgi:uncharacterized protein (UPF0332 family)
MTSPDHTDSSKAIDKALDSIEAAEHDLKGNFTLAATNRAYYSCYYCMTALLLTKGVHAKTHQGVRAKFSELFIKTNVLPDYTATHIKNVFELRQEADYDLDAQISLEEAQDLIQKMAEFYRICKAYLQKME